MRVNVIWRTQFTCMISTVFRSFHHWLGSRFLTEYYIFNFQIHAAYALMNADIPAFFLVYTGRIVTLEPAAVSQILALDTEGQCGGRHGLLSDVIAFKISSNEKGADPPAAAAEKLDETELEHMNDNSAVPTVSPRHEVIKFVQTSKPRDICWSI